MPAARARGSTHHRHPAWRSAQVRDDTGRRWQASLAVSPRIRIAGHTDCRRRSGCVTEQRTRPSAHRSRHTGVTGGPARSDARCWASSRDRQHRHRRNCGEWQDLTRRPSGSADGVAWTSNLRPRAGHRVEADRGGGGCSASASDRLWASHSAKSRQEATAGRSARYAPRAGDCGPKTDRWARDRQTVEAESLIGFTQRRFGLSGAGGSRTRTSRFGSPARRGFTVANRLCRPRRRRDGYADLPTVADSTTRPSRRAHLGEPK